MKMLWLSFLLIGSITCGPVIKEYGLKSADSTARQQPYSSGYWYSGTGTSSGLDSSSPLPSLTDPSFDKAAELPAQDVVYYSPGSYGSTNNAEGYSSGYNTPEFRFAYAAAPVGGYGGGYGSYNTPEFRFAYAAPAGGYGGGYGSYNSPEVGVAYDDPAGGYGGGYGSSAGVYGGESSYGFAPAPRDEASSSESAGEEVPEPVFSDVSDLEPVYSFSSRSNYQRGRAMFAQTRYIPEVPAPPPLPVSISKTASKQSNPSKATKYGYYG